MDEKVTKGTVLLVDDEEAIRESLGELLTVCGFAVRLADSYDSAVKMLQADDGIEVVVSDLKMPGKSGLEVLRYINTCAKKVPVIFLTGYATLESCQEAVRDGAFDYILKPIDGKDKVIFPIKHAIDHIRLEKKNLQMAQDILRMTEEHQQLISQLLEDNEVKRSVQEKIIKIVDKWKK